MTTPWLSIVICLRFNATLCRPSKRDNYLPSSYTSPDCQHIKSYNYQYEITVNSYYDRPMSGSLRQSWILNSGFHAVDSGSFVGFLIPS